MLDKTKRYLIVGLGLLGGKYALELSKAGFHVDGLSLIHISEPTRPY